MRHRVGVILRQVLDVMQHAIREHIGARA